MSLDFNYPLTRYVYRPVSKPLASLLSRTFVTPIQLTWVSAVFAVGGGVAFGFGLYIFGVALTLIAQIADCADGDLARLTERSSRSGAFLDSVLDRWTDAALIVGLGFSDPDVFGTAAALALIGSFLTSYTRARAQSLGADCPEGIATRDVRMLVLMVAPPTGFILAGLWTVAALGFITSVQRMVMAMRDLDKFDARDRVSKKLRHEAEDDSIEQLLETDATAPLSEADAGTARLDSTLNDPGPSGIGASGVEAG